MRVLATDRWPLPLPPGHRFPESKYRLLRELVEASGMLRPGELREPASATDDELRCAHAADWVERVSAGRLTPSEVRALGFPWSPELVERSRRSVGATLQAARGALEDGAGASLAGGTHHAFADRGEGFCVFNDVAVAIRVLQREGRIRRAVVVDLDVHQGNGTAAIFEGDASVVTLSVHGARNYPLRKERSTIDVELPDGCGDDDYLAALQAPLRAALEVPADLAFYLAGADVLAGDRLGRLALSPQGMSLRDAFVLSELEARRVPVAVVMAGGYPADPATFAKAQAETVRLTLQVARRRGA